jgi:hypothetical protein
MKTIKILNFKTKIHLKEKYKFCLVTTTVIYFVKNLSFFNKNYPSFVCKDFKYWCNNTGKYHNENHAAWIWKDGNKDWYYKDKYYGENNDFTNETWKKKVKELKREEKLQIFI